MLFGLFGGRGNRGKNSKANNKKKQKEKKRLARLAEMSDDPLFDLNDTTPGVVVKKNKKECPQGSARNPLTNRCKKTIKECPQGSARNPLTNRCKKTKKSGEILCAERGNDYYFTAYTRRCRKRMAPPSNSDEY